MFGEFEGQGGRGLEDGWSLGGDSEGMGEVRFVGVKGIMMGAKLLRYLRCIMRGRRWMAIYDMLGARGWTECAFK